MAIPKILDHLRNTYQPGEGEASVQTLNATASGISSHAEGTNTVASEHSSHAEGYGGATIIASITGTASATTYTLSSANSGIKAGQVIAYNGIYAKINSYDSSALTITVNKTLSTSALSGASAKIYRNAASGYYSHTEGMYTLASGSYSHAEGSNTTASGQASHAEGSNTTASKYYSHAEGGDTTASGNYSHAEGDRTTASGNSAHAEGGTTIASGSYSHAEGGGTTASGQMSHAEGQDTEASGNSSHAEGVSTHSIGENSHAEGGGTWSRGISSHAEGIATVARGDGAHAQGRYSIDNGTEDYAHIVGNGHFEEPRIEEGFYGGEVYSNAHTLDWNGNAWFAGNVYVGSDSGTNRDDGSKKLATEEYVDNNGGIFWATSTTTFDELWDAWNMGKLLCIPPRENGFDIAYTYICDGILNYESVGSRVFVFCPASTFPDMVGGGYQLWCYENSGWASEPSVFTRGGMATVYTPLKRYSGSNETSLSASDAYYRPIYTSTREPTASDGKIGDIWIVYTE